MKINEKEGAVTVTRTQFGETTEKREKIKIRPFVTDTATVSVKYGATISMGNYQSARIDIMLSVPCYTEEIREVYYQTRDQVYNLVDQEIKKIKEEANG